MNLFDFQVGCEFKAGDARWRCTDLGKRTIVAINIDSAPDQSWLNGPPYALSEVVFDECDMEGCEALQQQPSPNSTLVPNTAESLRELLTQIYVSASIRTDLPAGEWDRAMTSILDAAEGRPFQLLELPFPNITPSTPG